MSAESARIRSASSSPSRCSTGQTFETFTIDLSVRRHVDGPVGYIVPAPVIDHESVRDLPAVPVVPIENHIADKVYAMYETHWEGGPSTRYRDLADLVRIARELQVDAARVSEMLAHERNRRRLGSLPDALESPHESWEAAYPRAARDFAEFPPEFHSLDASLRAAGVCFDELLSARRTAGTWEPDAQAWVDSTDD